MRPVFVALMTLAWWLTAPAEAYGVAGIADDCAVPRLASAHASASLRLLHHGRTHTEAESAMTLRVPTSWPLAPKLLMSEGSGAYRQAMRCLVQEEAGAQRLRPDEWRKAPPRVTSDGEEVRIRMEAHAWVDKRHVALGPWRIEAGFARWTIRFRAPEALRAARWDTVEIDPDTPGAEWARPEPSAGRGAHALVWKPTKGASRSIPEIEVRTTPPWQRAWAARDGRDMNNVSLLGGFLWMVGIAAVATTAARSIQRRPTGAPGAREEADAARRLVGWVWLSPALAFLNGFRIGPPDAQVVLGVVLSAMTAIAMAAQCRRGPAVVVVTGTIGAAAVTSVFVSSSIGTLITANVLAQSALLCGAFAWARQLSAPHRRLGLPVLAPLSMALAAVLVGCHLWLSERAWERESWLSDPATDEYATAHGGHLTSGLHTLAADGATWLLDYDSVLTALAIAALLRARGTAGHSPHATPAAPDILLMLLLHTVVVTPVFGFYLNNSGLVWLGIGLDIAALGLLLSVGGRRSTLAQRLAVSGRPLRELLTEAHRVEFLHRARQYRELHATLRRVDHGQADETTMTRAAVERRLRGLHRWRTPRPANGPASDRLPSEVTVVDVVLAWGPCATWWENGRRAATYAALLAVPASALMTWRSWIGNGLWEQTIWGAADTALSLLLWELGWTGAGFLLGALWRLLPGRRGPARALGFVVAYALPTGLDALARLATDEGQGDTALDVSLTLLILTVTALAMDLDTFRGERRYWPSRLSLLLSVYQMRYLSLQMAYLFAQIVAAITIWQFVTDGGGPPDTPAKFQP